MTVKYKMLFLWCHHFWWHGYTSYIRIKPIKYIPWKQYQALCWRLSPLRLNPISSSWLRGNVIRNWEKWLGKLIQCAILESSRRVHCITPDEDNSCWVNIDSKGFIGQHHTVIDAIEKIRDIVTAGVRQSKLREGCGNLVIVREKIRSMSSKNIMEIFCFDI